MNRILNFFVILILVKIHIQTQSTSRTPEGISEIKRLLILVFLTNVYEVCLWHYVRLVSRFAVFLVSVR